MMPRTTPKLGEPVNTLSLFNVIVPFGATADLSLYFVEERKGSLAKAGSVVKKPYKVSRRAFHATRKFIFEPEKGLEEGYTPKYRYWPIISGCIVPVCLNNFTHFPSKKRCN
jgi:Gpi18-like mannosyltransferase